MSITTRRRFRCFLVMVRSDVAIHPTLSSTHENLAVLSFAAFERSVESGGKLPARKSEGPSSAREPKNRTDAGTGNIKSLEGIETLHHQSIHPLNVTLVEPYNLEFPKVKTILQVQ